MNFFSFRCSSSTRLPIQNEPKANLSESYPKEASLLDIRDLQHSPLQCQFFSFIMCVCDLFVLVHYVPQRGDFFFRARRLCNPVS